MKIETGCEIMETIEWRDGQWQGYGAAWAACEIRDGIGWELTDSGSGSLTAPRFADLPEALRAELDAEMYDDDDTVDIEDLPELDERLADALADAESELQAAVETDRIAWIADETVEWLLSMDEGLIDWAVEQGVLTWTETDGGIEMKMIADGRVYDTEKAVEIGTKSRGYGGDFSAFSEGLYRTAAGRYFLAGSGGPMTAYARKVDQNTTSGGSRIIPMDIDEVLEWAEGMDPDKLQLDDAPELARALGIDAGETDAPMSGAEFAELRSRAGMSQAEAAEHIGVTPAAVEHWEQGRRAVPQYAVNAITRVAE